MSETFKDRLGRVRSMADPDQVTWDLSEKDQAALRAVLDRVDALTKERDDLQYKLSVAIEALEWVRERTGSDPEGIIQARSLVAAIYEAAKHTLAAIEESQGSVAEVDAQRAQAASSDGQGPGTASPSYAASGMTAGKDRHQSRPPSAALSGDLSEDVATAGGGHQPLPPDVLANALQDPIHASSGSLIDAKPVDAAHQPKAMSSERLRVNRPPVRQPPNLDAAWRSAEESRERLAGELRECLTKTDRLRAVVARLRGAADKQLALIRDVAAGALDHVCDKGEEVEFWRATANAIANLADGLDEALAGGEG